MENTLVRTPILGTNQYKIKFGERVRRKLKVRFATKVKVGIVLLLVSSLYLNYKILRANYVVTCNAGGHFMSMSKCDELSQNQMDGQELSRLQEIQNNPDLFNQ